MMSASSTGKSLHGSLHGSKTDADHWMVIMAQHNMRSSLFIYNLIHKCISHIQIHG